jgi:hypothetical protein
MESSLMALRLEALMLELPAVEGMYGLRWESKDGLRANITNFNNNLIDPLFITLLFI